MADRAAPIGLGLAAHLGRGVQRVATDAVDRPMPVASAQIGDLDAAFLSQLMGRAVTSVSVIGGDAGTSSRARLALTGDGVPDSVFVKMPAETAATRLMGELGRLAETEARFYRELSPELTGVPKSYGSAFDPLTGRFVLVLEDLAVDRCEFPDTLHPLSTTRRAWSSNFWPDCTARSGAVCRAARWPLGWVYTASADTAPLLTGPLLKTSARRIAEKTDIPVETAGSSTRTTARWRA